MKKITASFPVTRFPLFKQQLLDWTASFSVACFLDNHQYQNPTHQLECIAAVGATDTFTGEDPLWTSLNQFLATHQQEWIFGHFNYDLKNKIVPSQSSHPNAINFPDCFLFIPEIIVELSATAVVISSCTTDPDTIYRSICNTTVQPATEWQPVYTQARISQDLYLDTIKLLQAHIQRGDCYEINFCQEFFAEDVHIPPHQLYQRLTGISPNPFSCFYRLEDQYLLCASPERFLQKTGNRLLSQPIKGTMKRVTNDIKADDALALALSTSKKDRSENVMIVDLVRNDLSRIAREGSVQVDELMGVYRFPQVHQLISTISCELKENIDFAAILQATFPMGSMTGAPKLRVIELIEQYEKTKRGLYSGTVGYFKPGGDFDFNVVIRSIFYNATNAYLNFLVGGGITGFSNPQDEYEECLLKALAIKKVLEDPAII